MGWGNQPQIKAQHNAQQEIARLKAELEEAYRQVERSRDVRISLLADLIDARASLAHLRSRLIFTDPSV